MRTIPTAAVAAALLLALAACGSSDDPKQAPATTAPAATAPALSKAEIAEQCTTAVAALPPGPDGVPFTPTPAPCTGLTDHDYLDAYMDGIAQGNESRRDALSAGTGG